MKFWPIRTLEELEILLRGQPLRTVKRLISGTQSS